MEKQVNKDSYDFDKYVGLERWSSYFYQIKEVLALRPGSVLEVGVGDGIFGDYIKRNTGIDYKSLDIADDLLPDIVGRVDDIPLPSKSFEVACAFEVLEHLPFDKFGICLNELKRIAKRYVVLSLPHFGPAVKLLVKAPFIPETKLSVKLPVHPEHKFNGQHYWEIGKKGYSPARIKYVLEKYFFVIKEFVPFENQYHHFYVLKVK